ncbi:MAG: hypothetical protein NT015_13600 [Alphaproteobacteria bacterium]|nr:hypothetical protein [Alphaproteobacteria bacterium]
MTDLEARQLVTSVLRHGETLVWWQAAPSSAASGAWLVAIGLTLFALLAAGAAFQARSRRTPKLTRWQIAAFAGFFVTLPAVVAGYFWVQAMYGVERAYGITNRRVLIVDNRPWLWVNDYGPEQVMSLDRRGDTVSFNYGRTRGGNAFRTHLRGLKEPERVELLIIQHVRGGYSSTAEQTTAQEIHP